MRKKLLSLLTVLCLVLGMLPATAMAIDTENIDKTDAENVMVVVEDTELTGTIEQLVLVDAAVKVDVTDATLTVGLVVSPDAEGAEITMSGTTAAEVVVLANATVKTDEATTVETTTVDAADATVEIAGTTKVVLTENAANVTVVVAATANVSVDVAEGATVTIDVAKGATVAVTAADPDAVEVTGDGAEDVTVEDASADDEDAEDEEDADDEDAEDADSEEPEDGEDSTDEGSTTPSIGDEITAPVPPVTGGEGEGEGENNNPTPPQGGDKLSITWGSITGGKTGTVASSASQSVSIGGTVAKSTPEGKTEGYWIGFAAPAGYTVTAKVGTQADGLTPVFVDNFVYFNIDALVAAAIEEAAGKVEKTDEEQKGVDVTGSVKVDDFTIEVKVTGPEGEDGEAQSENVTIEVSVDVSATEEVDIPAKEDPVVGQESDVESNPVSDDLVA